MGSFQQHVNWGLLQLSFILSFIIVIIINFRVEFSTFIDIVGDEGSTTIAILLIPIIFLVGVISPDVDLPRESRDTSFVAKRLAPVIAGITIGFAMSKIVDFFLTETEVNFSFITIQNPLSGIIDTATRTSLGFGWQIAIGVISGIIGLVIVFTAIFLTDRYAVHWGAIHSVGAAFILSIPMYIGTFVWTQDAFSSLVVALAFFAGFMNHLVNDQIYHELRDKHWRSPRYALKLWSNTWGWDPFIILAELYSPELKVKRKDTKEQTKKAKKAKKKAKKK